jgi:hypothetical protein
LNENDFIFVVVEKNIFRGLLDEKNGGNPAGLFLKEG